MKKILSIFIAVLFCFMLIPQPAYADNERYLEINETNFPDDNFRKWIINNLPHNGSSQSGFYMSLSQVESVYRIFCWNQGITSLQGIEFFYNLTDLGFSNNQIPSVDLSMNKHLDSLACGSQNVFMQHGIKKNDAYSFDLGALIGRDNLSKVSLDNSAYTLDKDTGIVSFPSAVYVFSYRFDVGNDEMKVFVQVLYGEKTFHLSVNSGFITLNGMPGYISDLDLEADTVVFIDPLSDIEKGKYVAGFESTDGKIRQINEWLYNRDMSFCMPDRDTTIQIVLKKSEPLTVDLSNGEVKFEDEMAVEIGYSLLNYIDNRVPWVAFDESSSVFNTFYDFDHDGSYDVLEKTCDAVEDENPWTTSCYSKLNSISIASSTYVVPITKGGGKYYPITLVLSNDNNATPTPNATPKPTATPTPATDTIPVIMNGVSLTLEGQITANFFVKVPTGSTAKTVKLEYAKGGSKTYTLDKTQKFYDSKNDEYKLAFPNIPAKEMTVPITLKVFDANGKQLRLEHYKTGALENDQYSYCVADWARNILSDSSKAEKTQYLAKALLNYGDYAQKYFAYNTGNPANPNGYLASEMGGVSTVAANDAVIPANAKEMIGYSGASLILEGATSVRLYFTQEVAARNANGNGYYLHQSGKEWYVEIPNIASKDLDEKYVVIVTKDGKDYRFEYSALSYANGRLTNAKAKTDIKNLCKALYLYNDAANKYFK